MVGLSDRRCDKRVARYRFQNQPGLEGPPASRQWMHRDGKESSNYGRRALLAWCDRCHNRRLGHELERRLVSPAATWCSREDRVRLASFGGRIVHAGLNCLLAKHHRTSRISRQSNDRFWLRTVLTTPDKQRPLYPRQPTLQPACPLSRRWRPLYPRKQT